MPAEGSGARPPTPRSTSDETGSIGSVARPAIRHPLLWAFSAARFAHATKQGDLQGISTGFPRRSPAYPDPVCHDRFHGTANNYDLSRGALRRVGAGGHGALGTARAAWTDGKQARPKAQGALGRPGTRLRKAADETRGSAQAPQRHRPSRQPTVGRRPRASGRPPSHQQPIHRPTATHVGRSPAKCLPLSLLTSG